jgi:hypothetical protein
MRAPASDTSLAIDTESDDGIAPFETGGTLGAVAIAQRRSAPEDAAGSMASEGLSSGLVDESGKGHPQDHRTAGSVERESELDDLLERLEARLLDEIDRRGGRYGGKF